MKLEVGTSWKNGGLSQFVVHEATQTIILHNLPQLMNQFGFVRFFLLSFLQAVTPQGQQYERGRGDLAKSI